MTIHIGSRYENSVVDFVAFSEAGDTAPIVFYEFSNIGRIQYTEYTWKEGDRLDQVAAEFYSYPDHWWILAEYNPHIVDPQNIKAGTKIRIPSV